LPLRAAPEMAFAAVATLAVAAPFDDLEAAAAAWDGLRAAIASGDADAQASATADDAPRVYVGALAGLAAAGGATPPPAHLAAFAEQLAAALANACVLAARSKNTAFVDALADAGAAPGLLAVMGLALPQRCYLGCAKCLHVLCASSPRARLDAVGDVAKQTLATTLGWCVLASDAAGKPDGTLKYRDRVLAGEVLKVCYAVAAGRRHDLKDAGAGYLLSPGEAPDDPAVTLIGVCLRAVLCGARAPYDVPPACLDAVNLLTCAPKTYYCWLVENGAVPRLCNLLEGILNDYVVENKYESPETTLPPLLDAFLKLCAASAKGKKQLKAWIFPPEADAVWMPKLAEAKAKAKGDEALQKEFDAARIHPVDAPRYATRSLLLKLMCDLEPVTKRLVAELVWALCDEDADEFTVRCGVGNAIAFLQIKKLMPMPKPSF